MMREKRKSKCAAVFISGKCCRMFKFKEVGGMDRNEENIGI